MKFKIANNWKVKGIYCIHCIPNDTYYIGSGYINNRLSNHLRLLKTSSHTNTHLQNAWSKYTEENFTASIIELENNENLISREKFYIDDFLASGKKLFNVQLSPNDLSGEHNPMYGRVHSLETKKKISMEKIGKKASIETRLKMVERGKLRRHSIESKEKLSKKRIGSLNPAAKISEEVVREIKKCIRNEMRPKDISDKFGVGLGTVYNIKSGLTWSTVK